MQIKTKEFKTVAKKELNNPHSRIFLNLLPVVLSSLRTLAMESFPDPEAAHKLGGIIRSEAVARLPELLERFEANAVKAGATVFWAEDTDAANAYILKLARDNHVEYVTKGKSMVTEEMGLNEVLEKNGIKAYETDLGEFITQLLGRPPFHIVGPAANIPTDQIRDVFMEKAGLETPTTDPVELGYAARRYLRDKFFRMKMGITGVNFAVAETGTIINVENEGNIRFNKSSPDIQVSVMTIEKVIPSMKDAMHLLRLVSRNCTGQHIGSYASMDTGPRKSDEVDGPKELHIVILDNGRSSLYQDAATRQALQCIRCGGCLNICPVYGIIGGYPYGWVYSGPMGQLLTPMLLGISGCHDLLWACTGCGACREYCPAGIDHPRVLHYLRDLEVRGDAAFKAPPPPITEKMAYRTFAGIASNPMLWKMTARAMRTVLNRGADSEKLSRGPGPMNTWLEGRDFPRMPKKTFHDRWKEIMD
ncbi:MAG: lactate utilization protein B [Desulfobacterales bacterium]